DWLLGCCLLRYRLLGCDRFLSSCFLGGGLFGRRFFCCCHIVSPSRDGKNQVSKVETRPHHRDGIDGLFIGTSVFMLALMNSAPAELLHLLTYAALQPC